VCRRDFRPEETFPEGTRFDDTRSVPTPFDYAVSRIRYARRNSRGLPSFIVSTHTTTYRGVAAPVGTQTSSPSA